MKYMKILRWFFIFGCFCYSILCFANQGNTEKNKLVCYLQLGQLSASQIMEGFNNQFHINRAFKILFGDGEWVVKTVGENTFIKFYIDPNTGKITGRKTYGSQDAFDYAHTATWSKKMLSLAKVVNLLEQAGYTNIEFVQWSGGYYIAHVCYKQRWKNIQVDAYSGRLNIVNAERSLEIQ